MRFALFLSVLLMVFGFILLLGNHEVAGYIGVFAPVVFQSGSYVFAKWSEGKEIQEKRVTKGEKNRESGKS